MNKKSHVTRAGGVNPGWRSVRGSFSYSRDANLESLTVLVLHFVGATCLHGADIDWSIIYNTLSHMCTRACHLS